MNKLLSFLLVATISLPVFSQLQDVSWRSIPSAVNAFESVFAENTSLNQGDDGVWYFTYFEENSQTIHIKRFSPISQSWFPVFSQPLGGTFINDLDTYYNNGKLYVVAITQQTSNNFNLWEMDNAGTVNQLFMNEASGVLLNGKIDFVVANDLLFMGSIDGNNNYIMDVYNLTNLQVETSSIPIQSMVDTDLAVDHSDNSIVIAGVNFSDDYFIYKSPAQLPLNFNALNGTGQITTSLFGGAAFGGAIQLIEKENNSPEAVFVHNDGTGARLYRKALYNNTAADMAFNNPNVLNGFATARSSGANTYVGGFNNLAGGGEVWAVLANGDKVPVAGNTGSVFYGSVLGSLRTYFSDVISPRLTTFYHFDGSDGENNGMMSMSNIAPTIQSYTINKGCAGGFTIALEDITFNDADGDTVEIISSQFQSSQATVIDPNSILAYQTGFNQWVLELQGNTAGVSEITFTYTDGFDTLSESVNIEVVDPAQVSFTSASIELCMNEGVVDMNEYVDSTGGTFYIGDYITDEGDVPFDTLDIISFPFNASVFYDYVDMNGCNASTGSSMIIYENPSSTLNVTNSSCGNSNGEIVATINSPNGTFNNYWNTGDQGVTTISNLSPGTYYHNVIDEKGCIGVAQANLQASDIQLSGNVTDVTCHGGDNGGIQLSINGANGPYNVLWSSGHSTPVVNNLTAGNYTAVVYNGNGCSVSQTFTVNEPAPIVMDYFESNPDCGQSNGSVQQNFIQGGAGNYSYLWNSGGTGQDIIGVPAGNYVVQVTDASGCAATKAFQLNPIEGAGVSADITKAVCGTNTGSIELDVFPAFGETITAIEWSNGETTEDIYNLAPGIYTCQIEQSNGCTADFSWRVRARKPPRPDICVVTVDTSTTTNLIVWEKPAVNLFDIHHYRIYRETNIAGQFQLIDTVHYSNISVFNDVVASPLTRSWRYRITAVTSCGNESAPSNAHKTIHLVMIDLGNGDFKVVWDNYEGFPYSTYDLLRYTDVDGQWVTVISNIPFNALPNEIDTPPSTQELDYMIEVTPPGGTCTATFGKAQDYNSSRSNKPRSDFNPGDGTGDPNNSLVKHENEQFTIAMYPNPTDGPFEVALYHEQLNVTMDITILNIQGKVVYQSTIQNGVNYIDLSQVESGVYFVNVDDGSTSERLKIIVK